MKNIILISFLIFSFVGVAQKSKIKGNRNVVTDDRSFEEVTGLEVNNKIKLTLRQASYNRLEIEADENLHDVIETDVINETLILSLNKRITASKKFNLILYVEDLDFIELNDDSQLIGGEKVKFFNAEINLNDKSTIELELETQFLKLTSNERSKGNFKIKTDSLSVDLKEFSKVKAEVRSEKMNVVYSGSSTGEFAGRTIEMMLHGNDKATFKGNELLSDNTVIDSFNRSDSFINVKDSVIITAKNRSRIYIFNSPKIILKAFEDNSSLIKRDALNLTERF